MFKLIAIAMVLALLSGCATTHDNLSDLTRDATGHTTPKYLKGTLVDKVDKHFVLPELIGGVGDPKYICHYHIPGSKSDWKMDRFGGVVFRNISDCPRALEIDVNMFPTYFNARIVQE